ncbi:nucleoside triphosphate pyrophosphohydrolase [Patescibacteria group bacterium]|nr:nucleoside triphosphate pyrophosphohydrolase [Patescibacteria group bacterium]
MKVQEKEYNKLVRDGIPKIIEEDGCECRYEQLEEDEYRLMLREKFVEEAKELIAAEGKEEIINELADFEELFEAVQDLEQISSEDVEKKKNQKREERGGFTKRIKLISVKEN